MTLFEGLPGAPEMQLRLDLHSLAAGRYFIILETPRDRLTAPVMLMP